MSYIFNWISRLSAAIPHSLLFLLMLHKWLSLCPPWSVLVSDLRSCTCRPLISCAYTQSDIIFSARPAKRPSHHHRHCSGFCSGLKVKEEGSESVSQWTQWLSWCQSMCSSPVRQRRSFRVANWECCMKSESEAIISFVCVFFSLTRRAGNKFPCVGGEYSVK